MAVTEYGTIGIRPMGTYDPDTKYDLLNLVEYDGSSYVAHTDPPLGSLPTNTAYWQVSAQGTGRATADSVGTVKPDGVTTEVSADGSLSVKTATQGGLGVVKGSNGIKVGDDGSIDINTVFSQATELANIIAGEAISLALGKMAKSIAVTMGLNENALLKSMLTNMDVNDSTKVNSAAYVHKLTERIGMGEELATGANLTAGLNAVNSNLALKANKSDLSDKSRVATQSYPFSITIPAGGYTYVDVPITVPDGYTLGSFTIFGGDSRNMVMLSSVLGTNIISVEGRNAFTSALTVAGFVNVLFYK